ncbi:MAG: DNA polymerase, partial [Pelagibacteraceae bacterium]
MSNIALIEAKQSRTNFEQYFPFKFDKYELCSDPSISKVLKKDVDISFDPDSYDWIILVGSEALKYYTKVTQVMQYAGTLVDEKFLPTINPSMLSFKPEAKPLWEKSIENIIGYVEGTKKKAIIDDERFLGIEDTQQALDYIQKCIDAPEDFFGIDSETTGLYPRNGYILGISLSYGPETGCYINANYINDSVETKLQELFDKKRAVFHNAKFDIPMFEYHFNVKVDKFEDTMLMHYVIDENPGTHGLKQLAMRFTDYGDYEKPMYDWIEEYRKEHGILKDDFKWEWIPFDVMKNYASIDACATYILFSKFEKALKKGNQRLMSVYRDILLPGCRFLMKIQDNGVPFSKERLAQSQDLMAHEIHEAVHRLTTNEAVQRFQQEEKIDFNPNSVVQLRTLLFDYAKLPPTGIKTEKGADSTNSEVLEKLSLISEIPKLILDVRTKSKIKNTYLDKIIPALDGDSRLRTNFNLHGTTSGRLSSSGKLNMQQLPRDNPTVKGCIQANPGNKIVAMDLTTAEVYVAAVLSEDHELQAVFRSGGNFHSTIAHKVFRLDCDIEEVAEKYKTYRQAAKAVTFGIMYGAG